MAHPTRRPSWPFPFPQPGRFRRRALPARTERRWAFPAQEEIDPAVVAPRSVPAPVSKEVFKQRVLGLGVDVGVIRADDPALAHELAELRTVYPHANTLVCLVSELNRPSMQSRYLPSANHELYMGEEAVFQASRSAIRYIRSLGGEGVSTTVGWPQEVSQRWADKLWPLSHKLVAQAAGLGVIGTSRNFLHRQYGAYCLLDTVVTNLVFDEPPDAPIDWNPCTECNLCVASCPTNAIRADGDFDFFACYNHTYRDSIPGFLDLVRDLGEARPRRFAKRWSDAEVAALWQSLSFRVEYRCFNCVATCPAEIEGPFHADKAVRQRYLAETLKPLTHTRSVVDEQFVIDTPQARDALGIPPGEWRTPPDRESPLASGVRLVELQRIRTSNVDSMMRLMPHYFRAAGADGLDFTCHLAFTGAGGGDWTLRVADRRCVVEPGAPDRADLAVRCNADTYLAVHRGERSPVWALLSGRIRLAGARRLFLHFPRMFPVARGHSVFHRLAWRTRRAASAWLR